MVCSRTVSLTLLEGLCQGVSLLGFEWMYFLLTVFAGASFCVLPDGYQEVDTAESRFRLTLCCRMSTFAATLRFAVPYV